MSGYFAKGSGPVCWSGSRENCIALKIYKIEVNHAFLVVCMTVLAKVLGIIVTTYDGVMSNITKVISLRSVSVTYTPNFALRPLIIYLLHIIMDLCINLYIKHLRYKLTKITNVMI